MENYNKSRRDFLKVAAVGAAGILVPEWVVAKEGTLKAAEQATALYDGPRELSLAFFDAANDSIVEKLKLVYYQDGEYNPDALKTVSEFLRDRHVDEVCGIDPALLDMMHDIRMTLDNKGFNVGDFVVTSAYRSPETNEKLKSMGYEPAENSQHLLGKAIDIRLQGVSAENVSYVGQRMNRGGVGYYKSMNFVHLDTAEPRYFWKP